MNETSSNPSIAEPRRSGLKLAFVLLQVVILIGIAISYYAIGWFGQEIKLKTVPVDPRDLLYGDYVTLSYDISRLEPALWKETAVAAERGNAIYVVLRTGADGFSEPVGAYASKPAVQSGEIVLKGRITYVWNEDISVDYGLEKYYVPEGTGKALEDKQDRLAVRVKVAPWSQAKIEGLEDRTS